MAQRTTVTLQDDVYDAARERAARTGQRLRDVINEALRRGLETAEDRTDRPLELGTFAAEARIDVTSTSAALDQLESMSAR
jgi:plasmid stability protein